MVAIVTEIVGALVQIHTLQAETIENESAKTDTLAEIDVVVIGNGIEIVALDVMLAEKMRKDHQDERGIFSKTGALVGEM